MYILILPSHVIFIFLQEIYSSCHSPKGKNGNTTHFPYSHFQQTPIWKEVNVNYS